MYKLDEQLANKAVFDSAPLPIVLLDYEGKTVKLNQQATGLLYSLMSADSERENNQSLIELLALPSDLLLEISTSICFEHKISSGNDNRHFRLTVNPIMDSLNHRLIFIEEITERRRFEEKLIHQASHDALTQLPNRILFQDRLNQTIANARREWKPVSLMYIDLDGFKLLNDTVGSNYGDELLRTIAKRLKNCLREVDTVARMGSDEFAVILPNVGESDQVEIVANRIKEAIQKPYIYEEQECFLTACIGITVFPADASDSETLIRNADTALHRAKINGRNTIQIYTHSLNAAAVERVRLESSLRRALERDEFVLFYQPIVDVITGRIIGSEALIRWMHPDMGIVSPLSFIPIAEETGQIVEIGEWVLRTAAKQNAKWHNMGFPVDVSINMSAKSFKDDAIVEKTREICSETEIDPMFLHFELTETALMDCPELAAGLLNQLKQMGIRISLDDFGTGYSSLSNLRKFPIDSVKIDRSFVRHITRNPDDAAIAEAIVAMAHSLKLTVVAEGVDTHDQVVFLRNLQCDAMQGYLISPPVSSEQFTRMLDQDRKRVMTPHTL